jgi:O-antigen/teichoic acid export membrane protein
MYLVGSKMLTLLALPVTMIGILWANDFFRLWVGKRFVEGNNSTSVAVLFWLLISSAFVTVIQQIGWQILMGRRRLKQLALMTIGEMMTSILLSISLVQEYGLAGVGVGVLISAIIFRGIVYPIVMCRGCGILGRVYLQSVCLRPCLVGIVLSGALAVVYQVVPFKHNWTTLSLTGVVAVAISLPLLLFLGLDGTERETLVIRPTRRLLAWLQRDKDICATREDD